MNFMPKWNNVLAIEVYIASYTLQLFSLGYNVHNLYIIIICFLLYRRGANNVTCTSPERGTCVCSTCVCNVVQVSEVTSDLKWHNMYISSFREEVRWEGTLGQLVNVTTSLVM